MPEQPESNSRNGVASILRGMALTGREDQRELFSEAARLIDSPDRRAYLVVIRGLSWDIPIALFSDLAEATAFANSLDFSGDVEANLEAVATKMMFCVDARNEFVFNVSIVNFADGSPVDWDVVRDLEDGDSERPSPGPAAEPTVESNVIHVSTAGGAPHEIVTAAATPNIDYVTPTSIG